MIVNMYTYMIVRLNFMCNKLISRALVHLHPSLLVVGLHIYVYVAGNEPFSHAV